MSRFALAVAAVLVFASVSVAQDFEGEVIIATPDVVVIRDRFGILRPFTFSKDLKDGKPFNFIYKHLPRDLVVGQVIDVNAVGVNGEIQARGMVLLKQVPFPPVGPPRP